MDKLQAREHLMKARIYRLLAIIFAAVGLVIFLFMFFYRTKGDVMAIANDPMAVAILLLPFIPAFVLSRISRKAEMKLRKLLEEPDGKMPAPAAAANTSSPVDKAVVAKKAEKPAKAKKTSQ